MNSSNETFLGKLDDPEKMRLINQSGVRVYFRDEIGVDEGYDSCWDLIASPYDGIMYMAPTGEVPGRNTRLVAYDPATERFKICFKAEDLTLPDIKHQPHSKLHTSINFLPDGSIIATTHTTAGGEDHPKWMPLAHLDHAWENFPGSYILHYDPKTGKTENLGQPVRNESIYGACYDPKYNALYMIGFMRGHVYRYSLDEKTVKDLGKAAEIFNYRLHLAPDGHIYAMTKSGFLYRINVDTQKLEDLNWSLPRYKNNVPVNTWLRYMCQAINISDHEFIFASNRCPELFVFDCNTLTVKSMGQRTPYLEVSDFGYSPIGVQEIAADSEGVLWYAVKGKQWEVPLPDEEGKCYHYPCPMFLIRWDYKNGGKPENLGIIGTTERNAATQYCFCCDTVNDILYATGQKYRMWGQEEAEGDLGLVMIDLKKFRKNMYEKGPVMDLKATPYTEEEMEKVINYKRVYEGEEVSSANPFVAYDVSDVTPVRLWRFVPTDNIEGSMVRKMAWDSDGSLWGISGNGKDEFLFHMISSPYTVYTSKEEAENDEKYFTITSIYGREKPRCFEKDGKYYVENPVSLSWEVESVVPVAQACADRLVWVQENGLPNKLMELPEGIKLPEVAGRRYLAKATATAPWSHGKIAVGTGDALFAMIDGDKVFSYGNAASLGPVRCMTVNAARTKLWGVAGYERSLSTIFTFDEENGLRQLGFINYNVPFYLDGPTAANLLTSIALSPDEKTLAVGGADRLGSVHFFRL